MSTITDFLIKSAGMNKAAMNAVSLRHLVASLPYAEAVKRFGKKRVSKISDEINNAVRRFKTDEDSVNPDYVQLIGSRLDYPFSFKSKLRRVPRIKRMADNVPLAKQDALDAKFRAENTFLFEPYSPNEQARGLRREFKNLFFDRNKFMTRDQLLREAKRYGVDLNPTDLRHDTYHNVLGDALESAGNVGTTGADIVRINSQLPVTTGSLTNNLNTAIANEVRSPLDTRRNTAESLGSQPKRSIRKALDIVRGQNVLEPGTRANRLYNLVKARAETSKGLSSVLDRIFNAGWLVDSKKMRQIIEDGGNAAFQPLVNAVFVNPNAKGAIKTLKHENSHMRWSNLPVMQHFDEARHYLTRLMSAATHNKLNIPWTNQRLMQEYLADAAVPEMRSTGLLNIVRRPSFSVHNALPAARINFLKAPDDVRRGLLQLNMNYRHPVFDVPSITRPDLP